MNTLLYIVPRPSHTHKCTYPHTQTPPSLYAQEVLPYAFRKLIDVLRLRELYELEDAVVPVHAYEKGDFDHMISYLNPACEGLIRNSIKYA